MSKWFITGIAGFIGSNLAKELTLKGEVVIGIDNLSSGKLSNLKNLDVIFKEGDINNQKLLLTLMQDVDYVIHLAAIPSVPTSIQKPLLSHEANASGTLSVLIAARKIKKIKKIINASSSAVYGNLNNSKNKQTENLPLSSFSNYAAMKIYTEQLCKSFSEVHNLPTVSLRFFNVFGPNQDLNSEYGAVIPIFINNTLLNKPCSIFGDGLTTRDFTYISNITQAIINAAISKKVKKGEILNIAMGESISLIKLNNTVNYLLDKNINPLFKKERIGDIKYSAADITKAKKLINFSPNTSFEDGLKKTIKYYQMKLLHNKVE